MGGMGLDARITGTLPQSNMTLRSGKQGGAWATVERVSVAMGDVQYAEQATRLGEGGMMGWVRRRGGSRAHARTPHDHQLSHAQTFHFTFDSYKFTDAWQL